MEADALKKLVELMDAADSALDADTYKQRQQDDFDAPDDAEYCVRVGTIRKCDAVFAAIEKLRHTLPSITPRFAVTGCSSCGMTFGPGDHGFSHCENHKGKRPLTAREVN